MVPWLREVGVAERRLVRTSCDERSGWSSRPRHLRVLYFPYRRLWIMEYSCMAMQMQAHTQAALQAQLEAQKILPCFPLPAISVSILLSSSPPSLFPSLASMMPPKHTPLRGAQARATARAAAVKAPPTERRSKRCHDPAEQPDVSSPSPTASKRGRMPSSSRRSSHRQSSHPRRKILSTSPEPSDESSSSSSGSSQPSETTPCKLASEGKSILKPRAVDLVDADLATTFPEVFQFFNFQKWLPFISEF
ncbi:hypothetical protein Taro_001909 [Colocasia esculenta]|uniref:Uncharacterized protein n=1 Tax=Colocasia esculenta TaxID=4460 RepID=A0A843TM34_COLES|nr:hypothetical protein [Colocasia esculenta]